MGDRKLKFSRHSALKMCFSLFPAPRSLFPAVFSLLLFSALPVFAQQTRPWWYTLEEGKLFFRNGAYGNALMAFDDARRTREAQFSRMEQDMVNLLSLPEVRRLGDSLEQVEAYIHERDQPAAAAALAELYHRFPKDSLGGSANRALEALDRLKAYPEAEYWLGETYRAEGELALALRQYQTAYARRDLLEIPSFETEILYKIVDIRRLRMEYQEMEAQAREILEGIGSGGTVRDGLWVQELTRAAMSRILENDGVSRFLSLYRYRNIPMERAHRLLGFFYFSSSRHLPAAEHLMFAFLIQNTLIIDEVIRGRYDFIFTTPAALMDEIRGKPRFDAFDVPGAIEAFLEEVEYFRTAYYLASAFFAAGKQKPARELWDFLASCPEAGEWRVRSLNQLRSPYIEGALEMP
jgi:tetratricopeptide (TPR) repeat protein